eukprot:355928_1
MTESFLSWFKTPSKQPLYKKNPTIPNLITNELPFALMVPGLTFKPNTNEIFILGGYFFRKCCKYNIHSKQYTLLPDFPSINNINITPVGHNICAINDQVTEIISFGGCNSHNANSSHVLIFDTIKEIWITKYSNSQMIWFEDSSNGGICYRIDNKIYMCGHKQETFGISNRNKLKTVIKTYNINTMNWEPSMYDLPIIPYPLSSFACVLLNEKFYLIGDTKWEHIYCYDMKMLFDNEWKVMNSKLPFQIENECCLPVNELEIILIFGGSHRKSEPSCLLQTIYMYDAMNDIIERIEFDLPFTVRSASVIMDYECNIHIFGGKENDNIMDDTRSCKHHIFGLYDILPKKYIDRYLMIVWYWVRNEMNAKSAYPVELMKEIVARIIGMNGCKYLS